MLPGMKYAFGAAMMTTLMSAGIVSRECDIHVDRSRYSPYWDPCPCHLAWFAFTIDSPVSEVSVRGMMYATFSSADSRPRGKSTAIL